MYCNATVTFDAVENFFRVERQKDLASDERDVKLETLIESFYRFFML